MLKYKIVKTIVQFGVPVYATLLLVMCSLLTAYKISSFYQQLFFRYS
jgi:hypothetical protein